ncbi:thermonuclease family protein [Psittacicella hinzii]|nr:thermonuclease family protein [Psittacicella hinzii]
MRIGKLYGLLVMAAVALTMVGLSILWLLDSHHERTQVKLAQATQKSGHDLLAANMTDTVNSWQDESSYVKYEDYVHYASCTVLAVSTGDQFFCLDQQTGDKMKISLFGIAAPQLSQAYGINAKQALSAKILDRKIYYSQMYIDDYGNSSCVVYYNNRNINLEMLAEGNAHVDSRYNNKALYLEAQNYAVANVVGLWNKRNWDHQRPPVKPWLFNPNFR